MRDYEPTRQFLLDYYSRLPIRKKNPNIIEYAETTIIPSGPYRGQKFDKKTAPYLIEPLRLLSPDNPVQDIRCMFPAQTGKSTLAELVSMYFITQVPSEILYVSSNETAAIKWMERRIVPRAHAAGVRFKTEVESRTSRKTGDTSYSKLFPGGNLDIASSLSPAQLASETKRVVLADEIDRWKIALGEEGSVMDMLRARMQAWGFQAKMLSISTPTTEEASVMNLLYLEGDQQLYFVPCPYCGTFQLLDYYPGRGYGLKWEKKQGRIVRKSIVLVCENQNCSREIRETSKHKMLNGGEWRKHALPEYDFIASFNINGIYSPFLTWYEMAISYEESQKGPLQKQAHENLKMGRTFKETGTRPKASKIIENQGKYKAGEVQDGVLYLVAAIDVQEGSETNENNEPRLEMEILGIGAGYRTWSIDYLVFKGDIKDHYSGAWEKLNEYAKETKLTYFRNDGIGFPISLIFIDSGSGKMSDIVYNFCEGWRNTFPIKGQSTIKKLKKEKGDEILQGNMKRYRASELTADVMIYLINTNYYKNKIYHDLKVVRQEGDIQRPGFCDFPRDYPEKYFDQITAEERRRDGSFHNPTGRRNEALDCRVYALCAADVFLDSEVLNYRAWAKTQGMKKDQLLKISHKTVLESMTKRTVRRDLNKKNVKS